MDGYQRLAAWQQCRKLATAVYRLTQAFPPEERFGLTSQLRRAAVSSCANIAEGFARRGRTEWRHFLGIALGSLAELSALIVVSRDLGFLSDGTFQELYTSYAEASKATFGLLKNMRR